MNYHATRWQLAAEIARDQHGLITVRQLHEIGIGKSGIEKGVGSGRLHRLYRGVYAVGHRASTPERRWLAAVLACGDGAVLSHRCASTKQRIRDGVGPRVDVTTSGAGRRRDGIAVHRAALLPIEVTVEDAIPITSPARTMVDLAWHLQDRDAIHRAVREMQFRRRFDRVELELANAAAAERGSERGSRRSRPHRIAARSGVPEQGNPALFLT